MSDASLDFVLFFSIVIVGAMVFYGQLTKK